MFAPSFETRLHHARTHTSWPPLERGHREAQWTVTHLPIESFRETASDITDQLQHFCVGRLLPCDGDSGYQCDPLCEAVVGSGYC